MRNARCSACRHPQRELIDAALLSNRSLREAARQFGLSKDALHRHTEHIDDDTRAEVRTSSGVDVLDVAGRVRDLANDARATRIALQGRGEYRAALRASEVELRVLGDLSDRLGIDDLAMLDQIDQMQTAMQALGHAIAYQPEIAARIVARLRDHHKTEMADYLEQFAAKYQTNEEIER